MSDTEKLIEEAFRAWWADFNADSDTVPGPSHVARAAFRAGYLKSKGDSAKSV